MESENSRRLTWGEGGDGKGTAKRDGRGTHTYKINKHKDTQ